MIILIGASVEFASAQTRNRPDPRGMDRYTLTGETAPLSIFSLPAYNGRRDFFDGWSRQTAESLGLAEAEFWNEFGRIAKKGNLHGKAVIRLQNGFSWNSEWVEGYLEGCTKSGKVYFNRVKILVPKKPEVPVVAPKELCSNIAIAVEDIPSDWKVDRSSGRAVCTWPLPPPERIELPGPTVDNTCRPGTSQVILRRNEKKAFDIAQAINDSTLTPEQKSRILGMMEITAETSKAMDLVIKTNGCDYGVYSYAFQKQGQPWWYWPLVFGGGYAAGYFTPRGGGKVTATKSTPSGGVTPPRRNF